MGGCRAALVLLAALSGAWVAEDGLAALAWLSAGGGLGVWQWRRRWRGFCLSLGPRGWQFQADDAECPVDLVLAPKQWLYGPLLLLSVRLPGRRWPRQLWVSRDAMAPDEFRQLCRALLVGVY